ncbi:hypothetical protein NL676_031983 [Syzygium grande]|nr:hypothetical protein NL676_031983 [Syzygium grande]
MGGGAGSADGEGYVPPPEFVEDSKEALVDLDASDSTELWLIQWPTQMPPDLDGQELTLKLHRDGKLGSCEDSSGKEYDVVSYAAQEPDATVFVSSSSGPRFVGKISRRVSLVRYPDPNELKELRQLGPLSQTPSRTGNTASTRSSRQKSGISYAGETSEPYKRRYPHESTDSLGLGNSTQDSGRGHGSAITAQFSEHSRDHGSAASSLSREHSDGKSKKKKKRIED